MPNHRAALPPWEKILQQLNINEAKPLPTERQIALLRALVESEHDLRPTLERSINLFPPAFLAEAALVVKSTPAAIALVASSISRRTALNLLRSAFLHRLAGAKNITEKKIPHSDKKIQDKYQFAVCCPVGERRNGFQVLLFGHQPLSRSELGFLRFVQRALALRYRATALQQQIDREAENLSLLTHHLSEGMAVLDQNLAVTLWNRPMQRLTGYSPREAAGKPYYLVFKRTDNSNWLEELMRVYLETPLQNVFNAEFEITTRDNAARWVNVSGSFMRHGEDQISQTVIIVRDVTQTKLLETRKNEFISIATHELRTPITAIKGYLSLLAREEQSLTEPQRTYLNRAAEANNRLARLAEDLLRTVQVEEDRLRINLRPVDLAKVLEKVCKDLQPKAESKGIQLEYAEPAFETWITADEEKIHQVFENLVDNAIKYTTEGTVRVSTDRYEDNSQLFIIVHVQDSGIGISSKNYDTIFEKFRRTHDTAQIREAGAGLGLFIVKSFVEKQGGKISVNSKIGKGTTFSVRFPATESPKPLNEKE